MKHWILIFLFSLSAPCAYATMYKYYELRSMDHDVVLGKVNQKINEAKKVSVSDEDGVDEDGDHEAIEILRDALRFALSRPNRGGDYYDDIVPPLRRELGQYNAFEDTLVSLSDEAMDGIKNPKLQPVYRATYLFMLENIMSEMQPEIERKPLYKAALTKIKDAKIEIAPEVAKELKILRSMYSMVSPSQRAADVLTKASQKKK